MPHINKPYLIRLSFTLMHVELLSFSRNPSKHYPGFASLMTSKSEYPSPALPCRFFFTSSSYYIHLHRVRDGVAVQHFTFVLTDLEGSQRFGFCRLTNGTRTCLCMLRYVSVRVCEGNSQARPNFSAFSVPVLAVIFHGLRCFTNFSTTWPITSPKDR